MLILRGRGQVEQLTGVLGPNQRTTHHSAALIWLLNRDKAMLMNGFYGYAWGQNLDLFLILLTEFLNYHDSWLYLGDSLIKMIESSYLIRSRKTKNWA